MKGLDLRTLVTGVALAALPVIAQAQGRGHARNHDVVPPGQHPPAGMCRVWIDGVPPGQQSAPTDCATATHNVPANAHVIYGDDGSGKQKGKKWKKDKHGDNDDDRARGKHDDDDDRARGEHRDDHEKDQRAAHDASHAANAHAADAHAADAHAADAHAADAHAADAHGGETHPPFPSLSAASEYQQGHVLPEVTQWLGSSVTSVTYAGNRAVWSNAAGEVLQVWTDTDGDGRADKVEFYDHGKVVRVVP
ncbi:MAG: hypothetical protein ACR2OG_04250 [Gemmatimonadaceae bacterium]